MRRAEVNVGKGADGSISCCFIILLKLLVCTSRGSAHEVFCISQAEF